MSWNQLSPDRQPSQHLGDRRPPNDLANSGESWCGSVTCVKRTSSSYGRRRNLNSLETCSFSDSPPAYLVLLTLSSPGTNRQRNIVKPRLDPADTPSSTPSRLLRVCLAGTGTTLAANIMSLSLAKARMRAYSYYPPAEAVINGMPISHVGLYGAKPTVRTIVAKVGGRL